MSVDATSVRLDSLERRMYDAERDKASRRDLDNLHEDVKELAAEVRSLRRAIVAAALAVAGSAMAFAFTMMQVTA